MVAVSVQQVTKSFGATKVLRVVDVHVPAGGFAVLVGPSGCGKSTLLRLLAGLEEVTSGSIRFGEREVTRLEPRERDIAMVFQSYALYPHLTVRDNLWMMTHRGVGRSEVEEKSIAHFPQLATLLDRVSGTLSGGQQQMLAMARGLATDPVLLVLDELSMGLAPLVVEGLYEQVREVADKGTSILLVEQFARIVMNVADKAALMVQGHVIDTGRPRDIEAKLTQAYLGG